MPTSPEPKRTFLGCGCLGWILAGIVFVMLARTSLGPMNSQRWLPANMALQQAHHLGALLFAYSNDHDQKYPDGKSSTEIFQALLDEGYANTPDVFYLPMAGKTKPIAGEKLKPENVCWDVTGGADSTSPDELPLVFMTGTKVHYEPGAPAVPLVRPFPVFGMETRQDYIGWMRGQPAIVYSETAGIAVYYKGNNSVFLKLQQGDSSTASIQNFIPPTFKADGKAYRQLTPEGVLP